MAELRIFTNPSCLEHRSPPGYPEVPSRLERIVEGFRAGEWPLVEAQARTDVDHAIARVHPDEYLGRLDRAVARGDALLDSADNPLSTGTAVGARAAVSTALEAVDWMMGQKDRRPFVAVRPPGHHAERDRAMGFCYFNTAAVIAEHLLARHGVERVAILDFDVHHGNGTQHLFEERSEVHYSSLHQFPFYPGTGDASERGRAAGEGTTFNVPLSAGCGDAEYRRAFTEKIVPELTRWQPDVLVVSAGFDAWRGDPLGGMAVSQSAFGQWGSWLAGLAATFCGGRMVSLLEGGYDLRSLSDLTAEYVRGTGNEQPVDHGD